ncbi:F-box protein CPR1-like [Cornus florida]|uniref:F-box protein CPR1-like n=1 Tax=Cornus florida TaxID=4283 RepID=UPI00289E7C43|nr:F-box protein CPR1-like [Cornus florida]
MNKINNTDTHLIAYYVNEKHKERSRFSVNLYDERQGRCAIELEGPIPNCCSEFHILENLRGLQCPPLPLILHTDFRYRVVDGYGFDSKTNDYKVVRISFFTNSPNPEVELYSLNRECWRRICVVGPHNRFCFPPIPFQPAQAFVNGIVHWVGCNLDAAKDISILTFDMSSEVFCTIKPPAAPGHGWVRTHFAVSVLRESLCLGHFDSSVSQGSIWLMKEHGVVESWTKVFSFDVDRVFAGHTLGYRRNGDLLFYTRNDHMFTINLESQQVKDLGIRLSGVLKSLYVVPYMESLVLPWQVNQVLRGQA